MSCTTVESAMASAMSQIVEAQFTRRLVFQRLPNSSEVQTDTRGFPKSTYTDIDPTHPIPCNYIVQAGREVEIGNKTRTVTTYNFTIPDLYQSAQGIYTSVNFDPKYRLHLLAGDGHPEQFMQIVGGGEGGAGLGIKFPAILLEDLV